LAGPNKAPSDLSLIDNKTEMAKIDPSLVSLFTQIRPVLQSLSYKKFQNWVLGSSTKALLQVLSLSYLV
jgi:hypothetical protein